MARRYTRKNFEATKIKEIRSSLLICLYSLVALFIFVSSPLILSLSPLILWIFGILPVYAFARSVNLIADSIFIEKERSDEKKKRKGRDVLGMPPQRDCIPEAIKDAQSRGKKVIDKYLVGFELETGKPMWIDDEDICSHGCVFAKTGVGKTLWLESLIFQQMARGRASGCTFIDAKRDSSTLAHIILMAIITGRIEDLIVIDPFDPIHSYNFVLSNQRADVKARKVLRAGLPPTSDQSTTKHYDRLAADSVYRMVRALESLGLSWSIKDVAVSLSAFNYSYPHLWSLLNRIGARQAMIELGSLATSYRNMKGSIDTNKITENLRGISSELGAISGSQMGQLFCTNYTDLVLTDAILRGKIIYFMLPRLEEAESASRMIKVFREDLEVSIGEITSSRIHNLEDPHLVIIDEGSSTFGPTWANLFELARKGRFALLFGAQSTGGLTDESVGLSKAFYERVMANVNLKVMMRIGDNRTASDMAEWIGKVSKARKSVGTRGGVGKNISDNVDMDYLSRESKNVNYVEDEEDLVSSEELKHEMSSEKGLAWFDLGNGDFVKGRSFWFNAEIPDTWSGREYITRLERAENDEIGLAEWVSEKILSAEENSDFTTSRTSESPKSDNNFNKSSNNFKNPSARQHEGSHRSTVRTSTTRTESPEKNSTFKVSGSTQTSKTIPKSYIKSSFQVSNKPVQNSEKFKIKK